MSMFLSGIFKDIFHPKTKNTHLPVVLFIHLDCLGVICQPLDLVELDGSWLLVLTVP